MKARYQLQYDADSAQQIDAPRQIHSQIQKRGATIHAPVARRRRRLPSIVHTALTVAVCGALFFGAVAFAPQGLRPQDFTGEYVSKVAQDVKARESEIQGQLDSYNAGLKLAVEQQNNQNRQLVDGILQSYKAAFDLNQLQVQAANQLRGNLVAKQLDQAVISNGTNNGLAAIGELIGQARELLEPGSGQGALEHARGQRRIAAGRLTDAAITAAQVDVSGYVQQLPSPEEIERRIRAVPVMQLPPPLILSDDK